MASHVVQRHGHRALPRHPSMNDPPLLYPHQSASRRSSASRQDSAPQGPAVSHPRLCCESLCRPDHDHGTFFRHHLGHPGLPELQSLLGVLTWGHHHWSVCPWNFHFACVCRCRVFVRAGQNGDASGGEWTAAQDRCISFLRASSYAKEHALFFIRRGGGVASRA